MDRARTSTEFATHYLTTTNAVKTPLNRWGAYFISEPRRGGGGGEKERGGVKKWGGLLLDGRGGGGGGGGGGLNRKSGLNREGCISKNEK